MHRSLSGCDTVRYCKCWNSPLFLHSSKIGGLKKTTVEHLQQQGQMTKANEAVDHIQPASVSQTQT